MSSYFLYKIDVCFLYKHQFYFFISSFYCTVMVLYVLFKISASRCVCIQLLSVVKKKSQSKLSVDLKQYFSQNFQPSKESFVITLSILNKSMSTEFSALTAEPQL